MSSLEYDRMRSANETVLWFCSTSSRAPPNQERLNSPPVRNRLLGGAQRGTFIRRPPPSLASMLHDPKVLPEYHCYTPSLYIYKLSASS